MKNTIVKSEKELSAFYLFYLNIILSIIFGITFFFKKFNLPGLSRFLFLFSFLPSRGALRIIRFQDDGEFIFPVFDYYYNMFFLHGRDYEKELLDLCKKIKVEYILFDGGANLGYISSSFVHLSNFCTSVIAIEPNIKLKDNLELNIFKAIQTSNRKKFDFKILDKAIAEETRRRQFFKIRRHAGSSLSSKDSSDVDGFYLDTISLNDLVENYSQKYVCFFKLDLEGAEFKALNNFKYFNRSIIVIEVLDFKNSEQDIYRVCNENSLDAFIFIDKWINLASLKNINQIRKNSFSNEGLNLLLLPKNLKDKVDVE